MKLGPMEKDDAGRYVKRCKGDWLLGRPCNAPMSYSIRQAKWTCPQCGRTRKVKAH